MRFLDGLKKAVSWINPFDNEEEERRKRQQQPTVWQGPSKPSRPASNVPQSTPRVIDEPLQIVQQPDNGVTLPSFLKTPAIDTGSQEKLQKAKELEDLAQANLAQAKKEREQGESWIGRKLLNKAAIQKDAEIIARSRAVNKYQEKNGYVADPTVTDFARETGRRGEAQGEVMKTQGDYWKGVGERADKVGEWSQYVPIVGNVINLGLQKAETEARKHGQTGYADDIKRQRDKNEFGMSQEDMANADPELKRKLQVIRELGYALSPLDALGLGGLARAASMTSLKKGVTKAATKQFLKSTAKTSATSFGTGGAISLGAQQYLTGEMDAGAAAKNATLIMGVNQLFDGNRPVKAAIRGAADNANEVSPGLKSVNPTREADAAAQAADIAEQQARNQARVEMQTNPTRTVDAPVREDNAPAYLVKAQRQADELADSQRRIDEQTVADQNADLIDTPAYERRGVELNRQEPAVQDQALRDNSVEITKDPALAGPITQSFRETGIKNPLSLVMHTLSRTGDKATVRAIVSRLIPDANPNTLNRAVNAITEADNPTAVAEALTVGTQRIGGPDTPLGPLSNAPAPAPTVASATDAPTPAPVPAPAVAPSAAPLVAEPVTPAPVAAADPDVANVVTPSPSPAAAPASGELPGIPRINPEQAPAAPLSHDALVRQMGDVGKEYKGDYAMRDVLDLGELRQQADGVIARMDDDTVIKTFAATDPETMVTTPQHFAIARAALDRLSKMEDNPVAQQQVSNILDGMSLFESRSGQGLRVIQDVFDDLPLPMKVRYLTKKIDAANVNTKNYQRLSDDPARAAAVEAQLKAHLETSQNIHEAVVGIQSRIESAADAALRGERSAEDVGALTKQMKDGQRQLEISNGALVRYFEDMVPGRTKGQKALVDFPKRMMLSSFTGRVNDIVTTTANVADLGVTNITQGLLAKGINLVKGKGTVTDTWKGGSQLVKGIGTGARAVGDMVKGRYRVPSIQKALRGKQDMRSGMRRSRGAVGRTIQAATEGATELSQGVRDQRLVQLADQEAAKAGLKGDLRKQYVEARTAVPSRHALDQADRLHMEVNNLNENPISRRLNRVSASMEGDSVIGGMLKNQIIPFTSWLGGNIWNNITDRNVVANTVKFANAIRKGDPETATRNLARAINGAAEAYAVGYVLAEQGILVDQNAEGYNDHGAYIKAGDRYIPVTLFGFFAPNIVLGKAVQNGMNAEGESPAKATADAIANYAWNGLALGDTLGVESSIQRGVQAAKRPGGDVWDGMATVAGSAAGQFIPALTGDVNAVLNNHTNLNPTKEAAETKVVQDKLNKDGKPSEAKDIPKSEVQKLKNRIPFWSQTLPRKANSAAVDLFDRTVRGNRDTPGGVAKREEAKSEAERLKDLEARGVPQNEASIEKKFQDGDFDLAIEGTRLRMADADKKGELSKSDKEGFEKSIRRMEAMKSKKISYEDWEKYRKIDLTDWRNLGDPDHDDHNPTLYEKLFQIDEAMKGVRASENSDDPAKNKLFAKKASTGGRGGRRGGANSALRRIQSNTVTSPDMLAKFSFGDLKPEKAGSVKMPTIQQLRSSDLIKKRKIAIRKA